MSAISPTPAGDDAPFDLTGGALCLDLANSWGDRGRAETDRLRCYDDLLTFGLQTGVIEAGDAARLRLRATARPREATATMARVAAAREAIYALFSATAAGRPPAGTDLAALNLVLPMALSRLRVAAAGPGFDWRWTAPGDDLEAPLWPCLRSAAELLVSADLDRVRECASDSCTWLFLDESRNRSRRWCDMKTCGNRAKARRHYRRRRGSETAGTG